MITQVLTSFDHTNEPFYQLLLDRLLAFEPFRQSDYEIFLNHPMFLHGNPRHNLHMVFAKHGLAQVIVQFTGETPDCAHLQKGDPDEDLPFPATDCYEVVFNLPEDHNPTLHREYSVVYTSDSEIDQMTPHLKGFALTEIEVEDLQQELLTLNPFEDTVKPLQNTLDRITAQIYQALDVQGQPPQTIPIGMKPIESYNIDLPTLFRENLIGKQPTHHVYSLETPKDYAITPFGAESGLLFGLVLNEQKDGFTQKLFAYDRAFVPKLAEIQLFDQLNFSPEEFEQAFNPHKYHPL